MDQSKGVGINRSQSPSIIMRQELSFVRRHVDANLTISLATFAGEAEVERFFHRLIAPAIFDRVPREHFKEQMRAAAGRMHFLARHAIAGAHRPGVLATAFTDTDTAQSRER